MIGALVLAICGGTLATLTPDQLRALRPAGGRGRRRKAEPGRRRSAARRRMPRLRKASQEAGGS